MGAVEPRKQGGGAPVNQDQRGTEVQDKLGGSRHFWWCVGGSSQVRPLFQLLPAINKH